MMKLIRRIKRVIQKPPQIILNRLKQEVRVHSERILMPFKVRHFTIGRLLSELRVASLAQLWQQLAARPCFSAIADIEPSKVNGYFPDLLAALEEKALLAMSNKVELLGSGLVDLGVKIDWLKDYKTNRRWPLNYFRNIEYCNLDLPSDVKFPWELSRMQWLIPVAQLYHLTKKEIYAEKVKSILLDWIKHNPVGGSVNWSCTMEVAMRIFVWTWFFHIFNASAAWQDKMFQEKFLLNLYWHGIFTDQFIEASDVNGNHYTADAAALVVAGIFWPENKLTARWLNTGWQGLLHEIDRQVYPDGVNFEASTAYHRLVTELFFIAAKYRLMHGLPVAKNYLQHLRQMAYYTQAYMRNDGSCPLWGDADDARVLPFGLQALNDHRYLPCLIGLLLDDPQLLRFDPGDEQEIVWWYGQQAQQSLTKQPNNHSDCLAFDDGGFYIMRHHNDHLFIDCGRVGLADRGGHGHNDCLSLAIVLQGCELVTDRGAYCYTSSYKQRNEFRATESHNTPQVDSEEINRFIYPHYLWHFHNDAKPSVLTFGQQNANWIFCGTHTGYQRLDDPVTPVRTLTYCRKTSRVTIKDTLQGKGHHRITIPLHFATQVTLVKCPQGYQLVCQDKTFLLTWESDHDWQIIQSKTSISPSYGVKQDAQKLQWLIECQLPVSIAISIEPSLEGGC